MIKKIFMLLFISSSVSILSQETVVTFLNDLKTSSSSLKDVIPIVNDENGDIAFFIADAKHVYGYKINSNFDVTHKISSEQKNRKYKTLIGNSITGDDSYRVFLTNKKQNKFYSIGLNFKDGKTNSKEFLLSKRETFIQTVTHNNQFYLISGVKLNNQLFIYTFDEEGNPKRNYINTLNHEFVDSKGKKINLLTLLTKDSTHKTFDLSTKNSTIKKLEENTPNSIELTSDLKKMYIRDGSVLFTFDHYKNFTQTLSINLNTFESSFLQFDKNTLNGKVKKSNSYVNGNHLFTIAVNQDKFTIEILDFKTKALIKKYSAYENEAIYFKNTPIIQEGGFYDNYRELKTTKQFLRKIGKENTGISVRKINNQYHIIIGGYSTQKSGGGMMMGGFGAFPIASFGGGVTLFFNPSQLAFDSFSNNKATRIESLFDENFSHVKGKIKENAFDKMQKFKSKNNEGSTVFKYKDFYLKTDYFSFSKTFRFLKFTD